ncbi:glycosyltransferase family 25 protein [Rariglobus hedericola]|uniref:Glycosyltransferase family 25 protein n=1 Tax=Rariglobus hedericola TaxID=2597822 RepID=A0A556QNZ7_9BACT|nr:glycosyltransferase family 25 protein [Rariglobus hedericola]TSJ78322.1 glycosyltransferase family 25 protein [Rariglobus hedericola]
MTVSGNDFWASIDAIIVVNLDRRADRWADMQEHLQSVAPMAKVHRLSAVLGADLPGYGSSRWFRRTRRAGTWGGRAGCILSHRNALRLARSSGWQRILILEDDARLSPELNGPAGQKLAGYLTAENRPGVCYLGYTSPRGPARLLGTLDADHALYALRGASTTHAYIVDAALYHPLLDLLPQTDAGIWSWVARHTAIDRWYSLALTRMTTVAAVSPQLALQAPSLSDITARESSYVESGKGNELASLQGGSFTGMLAAASDCLSAIPRNLKYLLRCFRGF